MRCMHCSLCCVTENTAPDLITSVHTCAAGGRGGAKGLGTSDRFSGAESRGLVTSDRFTGAERRGLCTSDRFTGAESRELGSSNRFAGGKPSAGDCKCVCARL